MYVSDLSAWMTQYIVEQTWMVMTRTHLYLDGFTKVYHRGIVRILGLQFRGEELPNKLKLQE